MLKRLDVSVVSNPVCSKSTNIDLDRELFKFYDKDGFELNQAEQIYYREMNYPIHYPILNHVCWQEPWFQLDSNTDNLILDHSMILTRCSYSDHALHQLKSLVKNIPEAQLLIDTPTKWGYDFALDAVSPEGKIYEVLHIEYDSRDYESFCNHMIAFEYTVKHTDWKDAANRVWNRRTEWESLKSFAQNDWKAEFLIGWKRAEYTEKSLT